ncbi:DNA repair protein RecN [Rhodohalobacter sulfatireducens]|uniref:DNA repair protein RecN n=1 Tax=Rhodohalobacter sulfatireducens TaxID=2911366 RepID=A0ABS9KA49_9BACT|nr:DNA repair protein RecN [Rhodohalobacter sulfatireducens]MCG2587728.1 DNA repair protein RecN [Rhodohalobacter sulfatireducens]
MIKSLYIKDFALIDELDVQFQSGLNVLTGQTGAGKSIIIGALHMILGERADTDVIRKGADKAISEAFIHVGRNEYLKKLLEEQSIDYSEELILRREIRENGSRAFINDTPVNISVLKQVGDQLVDLHGQYDHQLLLKEEHHQGVIDQFDTIEPFLETYQKEYRTMQELQNQLRNLEKKERELKDKTELYQFQVKELEDAELDLHEEEDLKAEMNLLDNAEDLDQKAAAITEIGNGDDVSLMDMLNSIKLNLEDMARIEPDFETYLQEVNTARISIQETIQFAERYRDRIEFNPQRLEKLRQRQSELNRLQKKYQRSIPDLIAYLNEIKAELNVAENFEFEIEKIEKEIQEQASTLKEKAVALHNERHKIGEKLSEDIVNSLKNLGIQHGQFRVNVAWRFSENGWFESEGQKVDCSEDGCDDIQFFISTNKGEDPKPLAAIASGGEVSRVMLSLKSILAREQKLPVMIFDEIDTGISGEISEKVGRVMRKLSEMCQIVAITHQPQIASQAHKHYKVQKVEENMRTVTKILPLTDEEHIREVASLMSGEQITESALTSARELIDRGGMRN